MRDTRRIDEVLHAFADAWALRPDLRFGEFLLDVVGPSAGRQKLLNLEDHELIRLLRANEERAQEGAAADTASEKPFPADGLMEVQYGATPADWTEFCKGRESILRGDDIPGWLGWWLRCLKGTSRYLRFRAYEWLRLDLTWRFGADRLFSDDYLRDHGVMEILRQETDFRLDVYAARIGMRDVTAVEEIRREIGTAPPRLARSMERLLKVEEHLARGEHPWLEPFEVRLPRLGDQTPSAVILDLLAVPGAWVRKDETILELETDKALLEVPSPDSGRLKEWTVQPGETVVPGQQLCLLEIHRSYG